MSWITLMLVFAILSTVWCFNKHVMDFRYLAREVDLPESDENYLRKDALVYNANVLTLLEQLGRTLH